MMNTCKSGMKLKVVIVELYKITFTLECTLAPLVFVCTRETHVF